MAYRHRILCLRKKLIEDYNKHPQATSDDLIRHLIEPYQFKGVNYFGTEKKVYRFDCDKDFITKQNKRKDGIDFTHTSELEDTKSPYIKQTYQHQDFKLVNLTWHNENSTISINCGTIKSLEKTVEDLSLFQENSFESGLITSVVAKKLSEFYWSAPHDQEHIADLARSLPSETGRLEFITDVFEYDVLNVTADSEDTANQLTHLFNMGFPKIDEIYYDKICEQDPVSGHSHIESRSIDDLSHAHPHKHNMAELKLSGIFNESQCFKTIVSKNDILNKDNKVYMPISLGKYYNTIPQ